MQVHLPFPLHPALISMYGPKYMEKYANHFFAIMAFRNPLGYFTSFVFRHPNYRWDVSPFEVGYCRFDLVFKIFIHLFIHICKKHCFRHFSPLEFCLNTWTLVHLKSERKHFIRLINAEFRKEAWLWSENEWKWVVFGGVFLLILSSLFTQSM